MSTIDDVVSGGWWPLRHHATVDAALRYVRMACMVRADAGDGNTGPLKYGRDGFGRIREVDGSAGDVQGGLLWEAAKPVVPFNRGQLVQQPGDPPPRDFASLGFAFPAVAQDSGNGRTATTSGLGSTEPSSGLPGGTQERVAGEAPGGAPPPLPTKVKLLPIQDEKITPDARYAQLDASCSPGAVRGTTGVVLAAMHERRMEPLFMTGGPLIAANRSGDPSMSSLVLDLKLDAKGNAVPDPAVYAPLHSAWRVVRLSVACAPGLTAAARQRGQLAWQLGGGGLDGLAGYGLAYDASGGPAASGAPQPDPNQQAIETINKQIEVVTQQLAAAVAAGNGSFGTGGTQAVGQFTDQRNTLMRQRADLERAKSTQQKASGGGTGSVVGAFSWKMGGPFDAGGVGCQHKIGSTFDGESVFSGHLRTDAYFRGGFDGPLTFEPRTIPPPSGGPYQMAVHLVWNPNDTHSHPCGQKQGKWWWYSEAMDYRTRTGGDDNLTSDPRSEQFASVPGTYADPFGTTSPIDDQPVRQTDPLADQFGGGGGGDKPVKKKYVTIPGTYGDTTNTGGGGSTTGGGSGGTSFGRPGGVPEDREHGGQSDLHRVFGLSFLTPISANDVGNFDACPTIGGSQKTAGQSWRATQLLAMSPGQVYRPQNMTKGARDFRSASAAAFVSASDISEADKAPATLRSEAFAKRSAGQWLAGIGANRSQFPGGTALEGGLWSGPADRDVANEISGAAYAQAPVMQAYHIYHPSTRVGLGQFNADSSVASGPVTPFYKFAPLAHGLGADIPSLPDAGYFYMATDTCELWVGC